MNKRFMTILFMAIATIATIAKADDASELKQEMENQYKILLKMQNRLNELEDQNTKLTKEVEITKTEENKNNTISSLLKDGDALKFSGDFRYRYENIDDSTKTNDRDRNRYRLRFGIDFKVNDEATVKTRFATGSQDPVSTNETEGDAFQSDDFWIDRAYLDLHPNWMPNTNFYFGKMANPFFNVGKNQLIWDGDVNPEGIAMSMTRDINEATSMFVNTAGFWVLERDANKTDGSKPGTSLWGIQGGIETNLDSGKLTAGATWYDYGNIQGKGALYDSDFFGNSNTGSAFDNDYDIAELFVQFDTKAGNMPISVYGNFVKNTTANKHDQGYLIGTVLNKAKKPGSWQAGYEYRDLEADAVVGTFTDSDFIGGGTNGKGHKIIGAYQLAKNLQAAVTYFVNEYGNDNTDYNRLQLDIKLKF